MATAVLANVFPTFPAATSVGAYPVSGEKQRQSPGTGVAPQGSATATASVAASGSLSFTGLADGTNYLAGASVAGEWRYIAFRTNGGETSHYELQSNKDVANGYAGVNSDSTVNAPSGLKVTETVSADATAKGQHTFTLAPRSPTAITVPVPSFRPTTTNSLCAFDVMPNGTPSEDATNGICWMDIVDKDCLDSNPSLTTTRLAVYSDHAALESRGFNGGTAKALWLTAAAQGQTQVGQVKINGSSGALTGRTEVGTNGQTGYPATVGSVLVGADGSDVVLGSGFALATTSTHGFVYLPSVAGTPSGVPTAYGAQAAVVIDTTGSKIWVRVGAAWKSVAVA
jgi:hypothetical protein